MPNQRDDFPERVKRTLAARVGHRCSNPECRQSTSGPTEDPTGSVNIGVAAHITAAAVGGPRYDDTLTEAQRSDATNGIWLCQNHAALVDRDVIRFSREALEGWKATAEARAAGDLGAIPPGAAQWQWLSADGLTRAVRRATPEEVAAEARGLTDDLVRIAHNGDFKELPALLSSALDRLTAIGIIGCFESRLQAAREALKGLRAVFAVDADARDREDNRRDVVRFEVITRVHFWGAALVRRFWERGDDPSFALEVWDQKPVVREARTWTTIALEPLKSDAVAPGLIAAMKQLSAGFLGDLVHASPPQRIQDLCQFDFLGFVRSAVVYDGEANWTYRTIFLRCFPTETAPLIDRLISDDGLRGRLTDLTGSDFASLLRDLQIFANSTYSAAPWWHRRQSLSWTIDRAIESSATDARRWYRILNVAPPSNER